MMYKECYTCVYISDCPHPEVDLDGHPVPPEDCEKGYEIILEQRPCENPES